MIAYIVPEASPNADATPHHVDDEKITDVLHVRDDFSKVANELTKHVPPGYFVVRRHVKD